MIRPLILWGGTGQAKVLAEFVAALGFRVEAVFDNNPDTQSPIVGVPLYAGEAGFARWRAGHPHTASFLVAIGGQRGAGRLARHDWLLGQGLTPATAVHPAAYVARNAVIGPGGQVLAKAVVGAEAVLGRECIVNTSASVDHECELGDGVHVAPGAVVAGCVRIGPHAFIGAGAVVLPRMSVGADAVVGAGAVVTTDIPAGVVVAGIPARAMGHETASEAKR